MSITSPDSRISTYNPVVATTEFPATFPVFDNDDIRVFVDGEERDDFAVSATYVEGISNDAKAVFAVGVTGHVQVVGAREPHRTNRFNNGGPLPVRDLNLALDTVESEVQELRRDMGRAVLASYGSSGPALPKPDGKKLIGWDGSGRLENKTSESESVEQAQAYAEAALAAANAGFVFDTEADFESATIPPQLQFVETAGYYAPGDGGGHRKVRRSGPLAPQPWLKFVSGAWWEIAEEVSNPLFFGAKGDGGTTDDYVPLQASIDYADEGALFIPNRVFGYTRGLVLPRDNLLIYGESHDAGVNVGRDMDLSGSVLLAMGSAAKEQVALGITDDRTSGGVVNNPDADFGSTDAKLSLASYYNEDANPLTGASATPAPFSAALTLPYGTSGVVIRDLRILLNFDGVNGYNNKTLTLADNWDVGLYMDNARYCEFENVQVLGYWRKNGLLIRSGSLGREEAENGIYAGAEENKFYNCVFQGWKSVGLRSPGMFRVMAITSTYIEVPWADNHPFDSVDSRVTAFEFSPRSVTITGKSKVGNNLRLMTATDETAFISVGTEIAPAFIGNGVAGTVFQHCRMHGMWHSSGRRISDPAIAGAMPPSACVEISGTRIRGPRFEGCKFQTVDDIGAQLHQCIDVILGPNARFEGSTPSANGPGGIRMISTPSDTVAYPGRVRETFRVQLHAEQPGADFTPSFGTRGAKFTLDGFWVPNVCGQIFQGGIFVGPYNENALFREYLVGGFTPAFSFATNGDLSITSQTRAGSVEYCGEWLKFNIRHSAMLTWSTASGRLRISLPRAIYSQANLLHVFECSYEGITLPAGRTQLHAEGQNGTSFAEFVASGSGVARSYISASNLASGAFVTIVMSGMYRFQR